MITSEKVWEDNYIHPGHIVNTFELEKKELLGMQLWLLDALEWNLNIERSDFLSALDMFENAGRQYVNHVPYQLVFVPRPIPNLKVRQQPEA